MRLVSVVYDGPSRRKDVERARLGRDRIAAKVASSGQSAQKLGDGGRPHRPVEPSHPGKTQRIDFVMRIRKSIGDYWIPRCF